MKRDSVVLGKEYILSGDEVGVSRPNNNILIVGTSGSGKSTSVVLPTIMLMKYSNPIMSYAKPQDARNMAVYLQSRGYHIQILDLECPEKSTISFDPILSIECWADIDALASAIVNMTIRQTNDDYWQLKAKSLLSALITAALRTAGGNPRMTDVLSLFDNLLPTETGYGACVQTPADNFWKELEVMVPDCPSIRKFKFWKYLSEKTASCVRDTLAGVLDAFFPESVRIAMSEKPQFDAAKFVSGKNALILISNAAEPTQQCYANLFYRETMHQLLKYAANRPSGELPREVRYILEDFACTIPMSGIAHDLSLFRSAGMSAILLLQSEGQLDAVYREEASIIRQNCAAYAYFPGGFDDKSCEIVSKRMGIPYEEVLCAPLGKVFIIQSGKKPVHIPRFDTLHCIEYAKYLKVVHSQKHTAHKC